MLLLAQILNHVPVKSWSQGLNIRYTRLSELVMLVCSGNITGPGTLGSPSGSGFCTSG